MAYTFWNDERRRRETLENGNTASRLDWSGQLVITAMGMKMDEIVTLSEFLSKAAKKIEHFFKIIKKARKQLFFLKIPKMSKNLVIP